MTNDKHNDEVQEIDCLEAINGMYAYLDGEMSDPMELARFEKHMQHCRSCYSRRELEEALNKRIKLEAKDKTPEELKSKLRNLINKF